MHEHALSLVDLYLFPVSAGPAHNGSLQCRVHVMSSEENALCTIPAPDGHFQMQVTTLFRDCETSASVVTHHTRDSDGSGT
ncbi:unnamed protein product [Penicillium roqueforti FM164]|uniref:Genomic scaffold, ProqFM164S01 n=1 Tax=Penicillium roqueforti (strain FM164) TaxID=1365484 RepID=W6PSU0_PENRF|nr:unnamed protein product [Penicillium roqueforti FM164]